MSRKEVLEKINSFLERKFEEPILFYKKNEVSDNYQLMLSTYSEFEETRNFNDVKFESDLLSVSDLALFIKSQNKSKNISERINFSLGKDYMFMGNFSSDKRNIKKIINLFNGLKKNEIVNSVSSNNHTNTNTNTRKNTL